MKDHSEQAARWIYRGLWAALVRWFMIPDDPPTLPVRAGDAIESFQPAERFLRYLKLWFWIVAIIVDIGLIGLYIAIAAALVMEDLWWVALLLVPPWLVLLIVPDVIVYIALHLRYDTTWYVMTERSLRIRRGIWSINEVTVTFENVQNVSVRQGPVQRHFGIANVILETAGGGSASSGQGASTAHKAIIEGVINAEQRRDQILRCLRVSRSAGLGDEEYEHSPTASRWTEAHLQVLRDIREEIAAMPA